MDALIVALLPALAMIESGNNPAAIGDNGHAVGIYQLHEVYVDDANIISGQNYTYADRLNPEKSQEMVHIYLNYYGIRYERLTGKPVTAEVLAAIHNGGPDGWKKPSSQAYAERVVALMERMEK